MEFLVCVKGVLPKFSNSFLYYFFLFNKQFLHRCLTGSDTATCSKQNMRFCVNGLLNKYGQILIK